MPGLNTELVRPSECHGGGCQLEELGVRLAVPTHSPHRSWCLSLQEEEEEDIDNLVEIHRQRVARGSMRSGTSSVSSQGSALLQGGVMEKGSAGRLGGRQDRQLLEGRAKNLVCGGFFTLKGIKMQSQLCSRPLCVGGRHWWPSPA